MKALTPFIALIGTFVLLISSGNKVFAQEIKIGTQIWSTKNLDISTFRNGDPIPEAQSTEEWKKALADKKPAWCYYKNDTGSAKNNGKLYNCFAVNDPRGIAPLGWHVPNDEEWTKLTDALGGIESAGAKLQSTSGWKSSLISTNSSGFSALPSGYRGSAGEFAEFGEAGNWWSSTTYYGMNGMNYMRCLDSVGKIYRIPNGGRSGQSVRCVKD